MLLKRSGFNNKKVEIIMLLGSCGLHPSIRIHLLIGREAYRKEGCWGGGGEEIMTVWTRFHGLGVQANWYDREMRAPSRGLRRMRLSRTFSVTGEVHLGVHIRAGDPAP